MFMPSDEGQVYALCVVDVASRYKAARPLARKCADLIAAAFEDIYEVPVISVPDSEVMAECNVCEPAGASEQD